MTASSSDLPAAMVANTAGSKPSRAGRPLVAAIAVGAGMGAVILASLLIGRLMWHRRTYRLEDRKSVV